MYVCIHPCMYVYIFLYVVYRVCIHTTHYFETPTHFGSFGSTVSIQLYSKTILSTFIFLLLFLTSSFHFASPPSNSFHTSSSAPAECLPGAASAPDTPTEFLSAFASSPLPDPSWKSDSQEGGMDEGKDLPPYRGPRRAARLKRRRKDEEEEEEEQSWPLAARRCSPSSDLSRCDASYRFK